MQILSRLQKKQILLLGSSRSGTTWLSEVLNYRKNYRYIFEPARNKFAREDCPFDDISPVPSRQRSHLYMTFYDNIFAGRVRGFWTDSWSPIRYTRRVLVKEVRANLALDWFDTHYPDLKIVFLIRNPYAVTASRARTDGGWEDYFTREKKLMGRSKLLSDQQKKLINSPKLSREEMYFLSWCIENIIPLTMLKSNHQAHIVYYEDLVTDPQETVTQLMNYLEESISPDLWGTIGKPSKTSSKKRGSSRPRYINNWQREMPPATIKRLEHCARVFGVDKLYTHNSRPIKTAFDSLIKG